MSEWPTKSIGNLAAFHRGITWASSQETEKPEPGSVPVLRIPNVQERLDTTSILFLRGISQDKRRRFAATRDWLLMVGSNGNPDRVGDCVRITQDTDYLFASFLVGVEPNTQAGVDPCFLHYLLRSDSIRKAISDSIKGTTGLRNISLSHLVAHEIPCPPPAQQRKIARILTTVDNLIEKTEALIAKYQAIKQGMMHDLFTRGVDEHGHLRPPYEEAPELYKPSELGWIPKEWEVRKLEHLYANPIRDFGSFSSTNLITFLEHGVPFIKSEMIEESNVNWENVTYISAQVHRLLDKSHVHKGNILFSKIGSALGKGLVYDGSRGVCNSNAAVAKIDIDTRVAGRHFVTYFLNHEIAKVQLRNMIVSLLPRINLGDLSSLLIPTPTLEEQQSVEARFLSADIAIQSEKATLAHLFGVKTGLMQDLLTGKVRVKANEAEEVAAHA